MKKKLMRLFVLTLSVIFAAALFTGCGPKKPTPEDAQKYVQAVIDLMCKGDYDHSVTLVDVEEGKETETRDALIEDLLKQLGESQGLSADVQAKFKDFMIDALSKAKYTVGDAVESENGGYDVTVTIEPLKAFAGMEGDFQSRLTERAMADAAKIATMSEDEVNNYAFSLAIDLLNEGIADPQYGEPEDVVVHYGIIDEENNVYGCSEEEGQKVGEKLFSVEGIQ